MSEMPRAANGFSKPFGSVILIFAAVPALKNMCFYEEGDITHFTLAIFALFVLPIWRGDL